ncbi:hypothetical protein B0J15DRAFT_354601, partial [Fusarium solani]
TPIQPTETTEVLTGTPNTPQELTSVAKQATGNAEETQTSGKGFTTLTSPSSSATGESIQLDLDDATLGENADITTIDGEIAILLTAPANGNASFTLDITKPLDIEPGGPIRLMASIRVENIDTPDRRLRFASRGERKASRFEMLMDDSSIYNEELVTTHGEFEEVLSDKTKASKKQKVKMLQEASDQLVGVTVKDVRIMDASR